MAAECVRVCMYMYAVFMSTGLKSVCASVIDGRLLQASGEWMWGILTELEGEPPLHHFRHNHLSFLLTWGVLRTAEGQQYGEWEGGVSGKAGEGGVGWVWEDYMRVKVQSRYEVCGPFEEGFPFLGSSCWAMQVILIRWFRECIWQEWFSVYPHGTIRGNKEESARQKYQRTYKDSTYLWWEGGRT